MVVAWSRTSCQHSRMATPSSLLISLKLVRRMCIEPLWWPMCCCLLGQTHWSPPTALGDAVPRRAVLWPTSLSLPVLWQLFAPLWGSQGLSSSPLYIHGHNCKGSGTQLPISSPVGLGPWLSSAVRKGWMPIARLFGCCIFYIAISHLRLGLLHMGWTLLLRAPLLPLLLCGVSWPSLQGFRTFIPFQDSSEVVLFNLYIP